MNIIEIPNLNENPKSSRQVIINNKSYTFNFEWLDEFGILDIYLDDVVLVHGRALTTASNLVGRVKNDDLFNGGLYLINKNVDYVGPTQETLHTDFYLVWVE